MKTALSARDIEAIKRVQANPGITVRALAAQIGVSPTTAHRIIADLYRRKLLADYYRHMRPTRAAIAIIEGAAA